MSCDCEFDKDNLISDFQLGLLDAFDEERVRQHIEVCEICKRTYAELNAVTAALENIKTEALPDDFKEKLHASLVAEQKKLYPHSESDYKEKSKSNIFLQMFSLRRFVPIAAVIAVAVLLSGKLGVTDKEYDADALDNSTIAVNRVNPDISQEFKAYDTSENENSATEVKDPQPVSKTERVASNKNISENTKKSSREINLASDNDFADEKSDNSIATANSENVTEKIIPKSENAEKSEELNSEETSNPVEVALANELGLSNSAKSQSVPESKSADIENFGRTTSSSLARGAGSSVNTEDTAEVEECGEEYTDSGIMTANLGHYVSVYSLTKEEIQRLGYADKISDDGMIYLTNEQYDELCVKLGAEPKFTETRLENDACGYDIIILIQ